MGSVSQELIPSLSSEDKSILSAVLDDNASLDVAVPDTMDGDTLWRNLTTCGRIASHMVSAVNKIKPVIGRLLVILQDHPDVYRRYGYQSFDHFMSVGMNKMFGISRTEAYDLRKAASANPSLTIEEFNQIGTSKLYRMSAYISEGEPGYEKVKEEAKKKEVSKKRLTEIIAEVRYEDIGEIDLTDITFTVSRADAAALKQWLSSPETTAYVGNESWGAKLMRMYAECSADWTIYGLDLLKAQNSEQVP